MSDAERRPVGDRGGRGALKSCIGGVFLFAVAEVVPRGCAGVLYLAFPLVALVNAPDVVSLHYEFRHFRHEG